MQKCPSCGVINTSTAKKCACGSVLSAAIWQDAPPEAERYRNLFAAGGILRTYGTVLKYLGLLPMAYALFKYEEGPLYVVAGIAIGFFVHVSGIFIAGAGEALRALGDIATNTAKTG
jgi:hypothetical protein